MKPDSNSNPPPFLAMGTWALAGEAPWGYGPCTERTAREAIRAALALGCRHFDTAALFGDGAVERLLGEELAGFPGVSVTTRVGCRMENGHPLADFSAAHVTAQGRAAAARLKMPIDRLLLHTPSPGVLKGGQAMAALVALKAEGLARAVGACVFEPEEAHLALDAGAEWLCVPFSAVNRKVERVLAAAAARGARVQAREVLHNGFLADAPRDPATITRFDVRREWPPYLRGRLQDMAARMRGAAPGRVTERTAIGYALGQPGLHGVVAGCRTAGQVGANLVATALPEAERRAVNTALYGL